MIHSKKTSIKPVKRFSIHHDPSIETLSRSILKTISYEVVILILNFTTVFLVTGRAMIALGFVLVSSIYTALSYFLHDRIWDKIKWGKVDQS